MLSNPQCQQETLRRLKRRPVRKHEYVVTSSRVSALLRLSAASRRSQRLTEHATQMSGKRLERLGSKATPGLSKLRSTKWAAVATCSATLIFNHSDGYSHGDWGRIRGSKWTAN